MLITGTLQILLFLKNFEILGKIRCKCFSSCKNVECCSFCVVNECSSRLKFYFDNHKNKKEKLFDALDIIFNFQKNKNHLRVNCIEMAIYIVICLTNFCIVIFFSVSLFIFIEAIYKRDENVREAYCRCDYYGSEKYEGGKFGHEKVYALNTASLFFSSLSFVLIFARKNVLITYLINLKLKNFDEIMSGEKKNLKAIVIRANDITSQYKEYFKASLIQIGLIAALSDDRVFAWCTNNASIEMNFFALAGVFAGILSIYSLFKAFEKRKEPQENFDASNP
jgi:hypothetical protein